MRFPSLSVTNTIVLLIGLLFSSVSVISRLVFVFVPLFAVAVICVGIFGYACNV